MIPTAVALVTGAVIAGLLERSTSETFRTEVLMRANYRDVRIPTAVGVLVVLTSIVFAASTGFLMRTWAPLPSWIVSSVPMTLPVVSTAVAFGLLGLLDDLLGEGQSGGFRGHLRSLAGGQLGSGMIKMLGGGFAAVAIVSMTDVSGAAWWAVLRDAVILALAANLGNLLDRAPGRTIKATTLWFVVVAVLSRDASLTSCAAGIGAGIGLLRGDLREQYMLGDAGSNVLGALCGLATLVVTGPDGPARWSVLAVLGVLNIASEFVSFSEVIDSVGPLRRLDRLGSRRSG